MRLPWKLTREPLLLFTVALSVGTLWLIGPIAHKTAVTRPRVKVHRQIGRTINIAITKAPVPETSRDDAPDIATVRAELEAAERTVRVKLTDVEGSKTDLAAAQHRVDSLRAELAALEAQRAALRQTRQSLAQPPGGADLEATNDQRREEATRLESDLERIKASIPRQSAQNLELTRAIEPVNKLPVIVELFENRITPVTKEYFRFPVLSLKPLFTVKRTRLGETIAEAQRPDSQFAHFLATIHPQKSYVSCLLNADSFAAFYAVRQLTDKARIEIGWEPAETSSGMISVLGVKLATAKDKYRVRVPDIVSKPDGGR